jgi:hypothetical protein
MTSSFPRRTLDLEYPTSLGAYERYEQAQHVVDYLSDSEFQVQHLAIVGTDLKSVERVTGRLTRARVAAVSAMSGAWTKYEVLVEHRFAERVRQLLAKMPGGAGPDHDAYP